MEFIAGVGIVVAPLLLYTFIEKGRGRILEMLRKIHEIESRTKTHDSAKNVAYAWIKNCRITI